jgi:hypothetical protein
MKLKWIGSIAAFVCIAAVPSFIAAVALAYAITKAPDDPVVIATGKAFTKPMAFPHSKHTEYKCTECHHDYKNGMNVWHEGQEVKLCNDCHKEIKEKINVKCLEEAYHGKCEYCHKKMKKQNKKTGPTRCRHCHEGAAD